MGVTVDPIENNFCFTTKYDSAYMDMAERWSKLSYCHKKQVGCLIVKNRMIISDGYNGTPIKFPENICEDENNKTHWYVLHAEANAILKCAKVGSSCDGATIYITYSPCKDCSKLILQAGIKKLVFKELYKDDTGINFLIKNGVEVLQLID